MGCRADKRRCANKYAHPLSFTLGRAALRQMKADVSWQTKFSVLRLSKQPPRSDLTSDLESMAKTLYATPLFWLLESLFIKACSEEEANLPLLDLLASPQVKMLFKFYGWWMKFIPE